MDFFGQQDRAKTNTKKLVALFCFAVAAIIGAIFALLSFLAEGRSEFKSIAWTPEFALQISLFVGILIGLSSLVRISQNKKERTKRLQLVLLFVVTSWLNYWHQFVKIPMMRISFSTEVG